MKESKVKSENYITIQGWMVSDLKLKGNELIAYAIIYGFSQAENQKFTGSLQYLADWTNSSKQGIQKNLKSLIDKGLIVKTDKIINGVKFCEYHTTKLHTLYNKVAYPIQQSCNNNIDNTLDNNIGNIKESKKEEKPTTPPEPSIDKKKSNYDLIIDEMVDDDKVKDNLYEFIKMRKMKKKPLTDRALKMVITKLKKYPLMDQDKMLENAIVNCWTDVYPIKEDNWFDNEVKKDVMYSNADPDWLNKYIEPEVATDEEKSEIDDILKDYR